MRIVIRTDASIHIGTGHVMRCLTLADKLISRQHQVIFICRDHQGNMIEYVRSKGYQVLVLYGSDHVETGGFYSNWLGADWKTDAEQTIDCLKQLGAVDWVIVDHYALDIHWENQVISGIRTIRIFVIDDLANRRHECHILLDQNLSKDDLLAKYRSLLPESTIIYLGPSYALLRDEFTNCRNNVQIRNGTICNITVFYGGIDITGETLKAIKALKELSLDDISIKVIVGLNNPHRAKIKETCSRMNNFFIEDHVSNMAALMGNTDLFIGAGGATTWERCIMGVPSITTVVADNQREITDAVAHYGATWNLGEHWEVDERAILQSVQHARTHPLEVRKMSMNCLDIIGDYQGTSAIIEKMASVRSSSSLNDRGV